MQDDFTVTPPPASDEPAIPSSNEQPTVPYEPVGANGPAAQPENTPNAQQMPTEPAVASVMPTVDPVAQFAPSDPGPIPPATSMNFTPPVGGAVIGGSNGGGPSATSYPLPAAAPKNKKLLFGGVAVAVVVLLAFAYVFAIYLPNTPSHVYSASLSDSGLALDKLIQYSQQQEHATYNSSSFAGSLHAKSPGASYDVSLSGAIDKNANANIQVNSDVMGEKLNANILSVKTTGNDAPDVYVQVTGVKSMLDSLGLNSDTNRWIWEGDRSHAR